MRAQVWILTGCLLLASLTICLHRGQAGASSIATGEGSFPFVPNTKRPQHELTVWTYRPEDFGPTSPIVFVMHGVKRNAKTYRDNWVPHSRKAGFLLLVPEFSEKEYPGETYSQGNLRDKSGKELPREEWTFSIMERLFDRVKAMTGTRVERYHLYGHSAGGQFVHRFVLFMPEARYARAVAANPGFYTMPTQNATYPYGLKGTPIAGSIAPSVLQRDFVLLLGEADTDRNDPNLRKTPQADAQGLTRFERGKNYYRTATGLAEKSNAKLNWRLVTVPGVGHSDAKMSQAAAGELFTAHPSK